MRHYSSHKYIPARDKDTVMAIGNFDGVHRGHQALLQEAREIADSLGRRLSVLTFEPHPRSLFDSSKTPFRLTPAHVKARLLKEFNVDILFTLRFDGKFSLVTASEFIRDYLDRSYGVNHVVVGQDFQYGHGREGDIQSLQIGGRDHKFGVSVFETVMDSEFQTFSSSNIRDSLSKGDLKTANRLLGWEWEIEGTVVEGDKRGRELGYPTANIELKDYLRPSFGVYAVRVALNDFTKEPDWMLGAANIGIRPMFKTDTPLLEVHILDFDKEIYEQTLRVQLVEKLRDEAKFDNIEDLKTQMAEDCRDAKLILSDSAPPQKGAAAG